jgi:hypothetical protein
MTLQLENGAPSFYTVPTFRPAGNALLSGLLLSVAAFGLVAFIFNYGINETLWSYATPETNSEFAASSPASSTSAAQTSAETITRISLPASVLQSLQGSYFSEQVNRNYDITLDGRNIYLQIDRQQKLELVPVSEDTLYAGEGHLIKFHLTTVGDIDRLDLYDNGRHIVAHRQ